MKKKLSVKLFIALAITVICHVLFVMLLQTFSSFDVFVKRSDIIQRKMDDIAGSVSKLSEINMNLYDDFDEYNFHSLDIKVTLLKELFNGGIYYGPEVFDNGIVIRLENGQVEIPEHEGVEIPDIQPDYLEEEKGQYLAGEKQEDVLIVVYERISGSYYYIDWTTFEEYGDYVDNSAIARRIFDQIEKAYDGYLIFEEYGNISYNGLKEAGIDANNLKLDQNIVESGVIHLDGIPYICGYKELPGDSVRIYFLQEVTEMENIVSSRLTSFTVFSLVFILTMMAWNYAVVKLVDEHVLTANQQKSYQPSAVRRVNLIVMLIGALLIFAMAQYTQAMNDLIIMADNGTKVINMISEDTDSQMNENIFDDEEMSRWYVRNAVKVAELIGRYPELRQQELLKKIGDIAGLEYLTLYDENGEELLCSAGFKGLSLTEDMADFMILTNGKDKLVRIDLDDPLVDKKVMAVGVRVPLAEKDRYGVLILNTADYHKNYSEETMDVRIKSKIMDSDLFMITDEEGLILNCTDKSFEGTNVTAYGIDPDAKDLMNYFSIKAQRYYGLSREYNDRVFYYFIDAPSMTMRSGIFSAVSAMVFVLFYILANSIILKDYDEGYFAENVLLGKEPLHDGKILVDTAAGADKKTVEVTKRYERIFRWHNLLPEQKATIVFCLVLVLSLLRVYVQTYDSAYRSIIGYIWEGDWKRGFNIFAFTSIGLLTIILIVVMTLVKIVFEMMIRLFDTKGETTCRLIYNFLQYLAFFCYLYYAFSYLGIDTTALLASAGFISLAISLGSRELVADVLAGLTVVFEGDFQVGDMVEIDGYRGKVVEIGVRSTKLLGQGNNIKVVSNRDIKNVINMTKLNSWLPLEINVSAEQIDKVEKLLEEELPKIGKKYKEIINGPYYYGILKVSGNDMTLSIMTECKEENYNFLRRKLNRELYLLLKSRQIAMK